MYLIFDIIHLVLISLQRFMSSYVLFESHFMFIYMYINFIHKYKIMLAFLTKKYGEVLSNHV